MQCSIGAAYTTILVPMSLTVRPAVLSQFHLFQRRETPEFFVNVTGAKARKYFMPPAWFDIADDFHADENLFEWIDLLESVASAWLVKRSHGFQAERQRLLPGRAWRLRIFTISGCEST
jgi:hypothetical protein